MKKKQEWQYLFDIIRYSLSGGTPPKCDGKPDWAYLYQLCRYHKIEAMVCCGLEKLPEEERPEEEIMKRLRETARLGTAREAVQHFSLEELLDAFEEAGAACLPLKGILLKQFYPRPDLRMMADLDILFRPEQEEKVEEVLLRLGYVCDHRDDHHNVFFRKPFMNIEMHHCIVSPDDRFAPYYENVWERARPEEGRSFVFRFGWEDFYIFVLAHMVKHFMNGGTGIRSIVDIWLFMEKMKNELDWSYLKEELEKVHLSTFEENMRGLAAVWFQGKESTPFYDQMTELFVESGVYGTMNHYKQQQVATMSVDKKVWQGQMQIWLSLIFLPYRYMKQQYAFLEKYPVLLPAAWIHRIFRTCFKKKGQASKVLQGAKADTAEVYKWQALYEELEL